MTDNKNPLFQIKNKVVELLSLIRGDEEKPHSMTLIPDYHTAFMLSIARAYDTPDKEPEKFIGDFYDYFEKYLVAVAGRAREDIKEFMTRREFPTDTELIKMIRRERERGEGGMRLA